MRQLLLGIAVVVLASGCSPTANTPPRPSSSASAPARLDPARLDPARINRIGGQFPVGYDTAGADGVAFPVVFWGFRDAWVADPPQCAALVGAGAADAARGLSGSGPGGTVYITVVPHGVRVPDAGLRVDCGQWSVRNEHSSAIVALTDGPQVDGAVTVGMTATVRTVVESGTQTDASAHTYLAYLGDQSVSVTLVTDPGATAPPLRAGFAADLLVASVAQLRS